MTKKFFTNAEIQFGFFAEFIERLADKEISIHPVQEGVMVSWVAPGEGTFELIEPNKIIVYPITLPNGDVVWAENEEEERKILERWNKMMGEDIV